MKYIELKPGEKIKFKDGSVFTNKGGQPIRIPRLWKEEATQSKVADPTPLQRVKNWLAGKLK
jgi:hypothetical protein